MIELSSPQCLILPVNGMLVVSYYPLVFDAKLKHNRDGTPT